MKIKRAKEIMSSNGVIEVSYKGLAVWLEDIKDDYYVEVSYINNYDVIDDDNKIEVPVDELAENRYI